MHGNVDLHFFKSFEPESEPEISGSVSGSQFLQDM